jgi:hypothetical protein
MAVSDPVFWRFRHDPASGGKNQPLTAIRTPGGCQAASVFTQCDNSGTFPPQARMIALTPRLIALTSTTKVLPSKNIAL